jgi:hypothetical protein
VISNVGDFGIAIITSGMLFFMLSCRLAPTDMPFVQHKRQTIYFSEGSEKAARGGGVNEGQSKFHMGTWAMSQIRPNIHLFQLDQDYVTIKSY